MPPLHHAVIAQLAAGVLALVVVAAFPTVLSWPLLLAAGQGVAAALAAAWLKAPRWWLAIHLAFMPLVALANRLDIEPAWYLLAFLLLLAVFWRTDRSRVPLYLSNAVTADAVLALLPPGSCKVIDLGCGDGALLRRLARARPDSRFLGIEHAPLPWLWARLAALGQPNCEIRFGDFWQRSLTGFDLVYAFLSPAPMLRLWEKSRLEMTPGTLLVSNSFPVPEIAAESTLELGDRRATRLFCYRPGNR